MLNDDVDKFWVSTEVILKRFFIRDSVIYPDEGGGVGGSKYI
jgi:hypothetical protein